MHPLLLNGFADEISKIAAKKYEPDYGPEKRIARGVAAGAGVLGGTAGLGAIALGQSSANASHLRPGDVRAIGKKMGVKTPMYINTRKGGDSNLHHIGGKFPNMPFVADNAKGNISTLAIDRSKRWSRGLLMEKVLPKRPIVNIPHGAGDAFAAHELGHVKNMALLKRLKLHTPANLVRSVGQGPIGVLGGLGGSAYAAGSEDPKWAPALVQAGLYAPTLTGEAMASGRAMKYLMKEHGVVKGLARGAKLAPAFGTYAALGLSPLAITAARKAMKRHKEKKSGINPFLSSQARRTLNKEIVAKLGDLAEATVPKKEAAAKDKANALFGLPLHPRKRNTRSYEQGSDAAASPDRSTSPISGQGTANVAGSNTVSPTTGPGGV